MRYSSAIKRFSWVVVVAAIIGAICGVLIAKVLPTSYQVSTTILVEVGAPGTSITSVTTQVDPSLSLAEANTYAAQIPTRSVTQFLLQKYPEIAQRGFTADDLLTDITAVASTSAATVSISAIAAKPEDAVMLANDAANGFAAFTQQRAQNNLNLQRSSLQSQLAGLQNERTTDEKLVESVTTADPHYQVYLNELQGVNQEINTVNGQLLPLPTSVRSDVTVVQEAKLADATASVKSPIIIGAAAALGLVLGVLIMLLLVSNDKHLSDGDQVKEKLEIACLGSLETHATLKSFPIRISGDALQEVADIATNLRLTNVLSGAWHAPDASTLLVTSSQGAAGKTSVTVALATALARTGLNVVVVDANLRKPATHRAFGINPSGPGLSGLLKGAGTIDDAVVRSNTPGIWLIPAGGTIEDPALLLEQRFPAILAQLRKKADLVLIDGAALLSSADAALLASLVDGVALVVDARRDTLPLLLRTKDILDTLTHTPAGAIINYMPRKRNNRYYAIGYSGQPTAAPAPDKAAPLPMLAPMPYPAPVQMPLPQPAAANGYQGNVTNGQRPSPLTPAFPPPPVAGTPSASGLTGNGMPPFVVQQQPVSVPPAQANNMNGNKPRGGAANPPFPLLPLPPQR